VEKKLITLKVQSRQEWREWLQSHHDSESIIWLVFDKGPLKDRHAISYDEAVEEALCFGWIDSLVRRLDDRRYARKFTPRKPGSKWSTINRKRYAKLKADGLLSAPGLQREPTSRSGDAPRVSDTNIPGYIEKRLKTNRAAWDHFLKIAPSYRRMYVAWIDSAKREETKEARLHEAIKLLARGKKLGLK
jgi:uncharacterized protein YdeI (YjbR/CyaY-like superfamily)